MAAHGRIEGGHDTKLQAVAIQQLVEHAPLLANVTLPRTGDPDRMAHSAVALSADNMLILEQPTLRVPLEGMRKQYRLTSKLDKDMSSVQTAASKFKGKGVPREERLKAVESHLNKLKGVKRKLEDAQTFQSSLVSSSKARLDHLLQLDNLASFASRSYPGWSHLRLQRHLVDYLLRNGHATTAELLSRDEAMNGLIDVEVDLFNELGRIETALKSGSAAEALAWCKENSPSLKKARSSLEFDLRFQEFIELARLRKRHEAIAYCKRHLVPSAIPSLDSAAVTSTSTQCGPSQIKQAMALLAFGPDTSCPPYRALYDALRWTSLARTFRRAYLALYCLPPLPLLSLSIWAGLAGLKLPSCSSSDMSEHSSDCPTCSGADHGQFSILSRQPEVPSGHHANSVIVCKVTGKVLAGEDPAYALPNGMVYSGEALEEIARKGQGRVRDPRSGTIYDWSELKKVYIT